MKIDNFDNKKAYENGYSEGEFDLRWKICEVPRNILENENGISDKIVSDNETEISFVNKGTRRPSTRGERSKATEKAKRKAKRNEPFTYSLVNHGDYVIHKGNTFSWHPEWKKIDRRIRRHEGKNLCFNYEAEDATETENWLTPDEGWLEDYPDIVSEMEYVTDLTILLEGKSPYKEWMEREKTIEEKFERKQNLYEYYLDPGPEIWNEEEGRYYEGKPIPSGQAALEWIREHNLINELERWVKEKIGKI